jgi:protein pelota
MDIELNQSIRLEKDCWDVIVLERLEEACDPAAKADLAAVVMQEGLANICLITSSMTISKAKIERTMPKKNQVASPFTHHSRQFTHPPLFPSPPSPKLS